MILLIMLMIAGCLAASYTRANPDTLIQEPFIIKAAARGEALWALHQSFHHTQLKYKDSCIEAYYRDPENLAGFGKTLSAIDLPAAIVKKIHRRFHECSITNVMLFIDAKGSIWYYAGVLHKNELVGIKISSGCRINVLQKIALN
jgi:hypothetical protein